VRIIVGAEDRLLGANKKFSDQLTSLGIEHQYDTLPGVGHDYGKFYEKLGQRGIGYYQAVFSEK